MTFLDLYARLRAMHEHRGWHWWPDADPFEVIVGSILVQNTSWDNVERALAQLREANVLEPGALASLTGEDLEALVRSSGQYRQKAKKLRAFLDLVAEHGSLEALLALPAETLRARLLATWGVGKETADCIVNYAAHQPAMVVDAYTARLFSRLGLGPGESAGYDAWQRYCEAGLDEDAARAAGETLRDLRARFHALVVMHCKHLCRKRAPRCEACLLLPHCATGKQVLA